MGGGVIKKEIEPQCHEQAVFWADATLWRLWVHHVHSDYQNAEIKLSKDNVLGSANNSLKCSKVSIIQKSLFCFQSIYEPLNVFYDRELKSI